MSSADPAARAGVGLIIPPHEVRVVLEKTAEAVSRKPALEAVIKERCANQAKFSFLFENDPYYPYYKSKAKVPDSAAPKAPSDSSTSIATTQRVVALADDSVTTTAAPVVSKLRLERAKSEQTRAVSTEAPLPDLCALPLQTPTPSKFQLDVIKLTAQYTAVNGSEVEDALRRKEAHNSLFDFLTPASTYHAIYVGLCKAYATVLDVQREPGAHTATLSDKKDALWERVWHKVGWGRIMSKNRVEQGATDPYVSTVDWHDFAAVVTVDVESDDEGLPPAVVDIRALPRVLVAAETEAEAQRRPLHGSGANGGYLGLDNEDDVHVADVHGEVPMERVGLPTGPVAAASPPPEPSVLLPSGQLVPRSRAEAAVRVELLDASYKEERSRAGDKFQERNLASDAEMVRSLTAMTKARAASGSEVYNRAGLQAGLSSRPTMGEEADGAIPPPEKRARIEAARAALNTKGAPREEDDDPIHASLGENGAAVVDLAPPPPPPGLIDAKEWVSRVGAAVPITLQVVKHANPAWDASGQVIEMKAPLENTVGDLKRYLAQMVKIPLNKQKLQFGSGAYMKDAMSLAYYNVHAGAVLRLEVKERGKRSRGKGGGQ